MKKNLSLFTLFCFTTTICFSQNFLVPNGTVTNLNPAVPAPVSGEIARFGATATTGTQFFTQYFGGALPSGTLRFGLGDRWISSGQIVPPSTQVLTGYRAQRDGRTLAIGIDAKPSPTATLDAFIEWGGNSSIASGNIGQLPGDLLFRNFTSPTSAAPGLVMRLTAESKMLVGDPGTSTPNYPTYPFRRAKIESYDGKTPVPYYSSTLPTG